MRSRKVGGPSPEQTGTLPESKHDRPTNEDINTKVDQLIRMRNKPGQTRAHYSATITELVALAQGKDPYGTREDYPGWTNEDFRKVLKELVEPKEFEEAPPWR
jgi:hypothetical protein